MPRADLIITKASGHKEPLDLTKLGGSLRRAGLAGDTATKISQAVAAQLPANSTSEQILEATLKELRKENKALAARYDLKRAIMNMGPTGFPFERYVAKILHAYNYEVQIDQRIPGYCVTHEVDVVARKGDKHIIVECKYHNDRGNASDLHVALYTHARFMDIEARWQDQEAARRGREAHYHEVWLVTNTRCTSDALAYAKCHNIKVISWHFPFAPTLRVGANEASPPDASLETLIEQKNLYPITILPSVRPALRDSLFAQNIHLVTELNKFTPAVLARVANLPPGIAQKVLSEARLFGN